MSARQKFKDLVLLLKRDRRAQVIAAVVAFFLLWGFMADDTRHRKGVREATPLMQPGSGAMSGEEAYNDLVTRFSSDLDVIKKQSLDNAEELQAQRQYMQQQEERTAEIFKRVLERIADIEGTVQSGLGAGAEPVNIEPEGLPGDQEDTLSPWGDLDKEEVAPPAAPAPRKIAFVGAGDSVRVKLLAGVDAPTDGTPYPVIFKLVGDINGPDGSALPIGEARLIAAAQGSLTDTRALFRLTHLNVRYPDGSRKVTKIDGWVVGEDGIRGMEGFLIDPMGKAIAGSFTSGFVEGAGKGIETANSTIFIDQNGSTHQFVNGDLLEYALGAGLGKAGERWSDFIDERARLLVPHVRIFSGREATAVFSQNIELEGLFDQVEDEGFQFVSLD